ncbi:alpha/beta hydrolase [Bacillus tianshenii]|nr:alpha/beta hydrolase [Bacillus tianshenii]
MMIFGIIVGVIAVLMLIGWIIHSTYFKRKLEQIKPYGQFVDVEDGHMHVYSMGSGEKTIVLLPGMGVGLPTADFAPLMRKLSEKYKVVIVEYFGVGFSSETSKPRTSENYVEEIRAALYQAGFKAPYVLMPHSISSVYSEHYAAKYPEEVEAIISLDGTSTAFYAEMPAVIKSILPIAKFQQAIGTLSFIAPLTVNKKKLLSNGYSEKEISEMVIFAGFSINNTLLEQMASSSEFIKQTIDLPFPESVPYFKIISKQTYETSNTQFKKAKMTPQEYQYKHLERIGKHAKYEVLNGTHFIYLNNVDRIAKITEDLLFNAEPINEESPPLR